jgi:DNA invertase Pin-like site-specific DNA recombinase
LLIEVLYPLVGRPGRKFIAYFRLSTERQGKSGLGLAAQHRKISEFVASAGALIAEFCDILSGRDDSREQLHRASLVFIEI